MFMQTRSSEADLEPLNLEIECTCRANRRNKKVEIGDLVDQQNKIRDLEAELERLRLERERQPQLLNQDEVAMTDLMVPTRPRNRAGVIIPPIQANNFELKSSTIQMVQSYGQFSGGIHENPSEHLDKFLMVADTVKYNGVPQDVIRLKLFPFSLNGGASEWYKSLHPGSVTSWDDMESKFCRTISRLQRRCN